MSVVHFLTKLSEHYLTFKSTKTLTFDPFGYTAFQFSYLMFIKTVIYFEILVDKALQAL